MNTRRGSFRISGIALGALLALGTMPAMAKEDDPTEDIARAKATLATFKANDPGLEKHLAGAAGYAVFYDIGKGGLVVGGAGGKGILFEKGMATGRTSLSQVTVGAQVGGKSYTELIIFKDAAALKDFRDSKFAFSSDASAVAGGAGASQTLNYTRGVAVLTLDKSGLMAEATIGGQKFKFKPFEHPIPKT